jgi:hypothetical protein
MRKSNFNIKVPNFHFHAFLNQNWTIRLHVGLAEMRSFYEYTSTTRNNGQIFTLNISFKEIKRSVSIITTNLNNKNNTIAVTGRRGLKGCEMLRIPRCQDGRITNGGKVASPTHWPRSTPKKLYISASDTHFCQRLSKFQGLVRPEGLGKLKTFNHPVGFRTDDLVACSIMY